MNDKETAKFYEIIRECNRISGGNNDDTGKMLESKNPLAVAQNMYRTMCRVCRVKPDVYFAGESVMNAIKQAELEEEKYGWH